MLKVEKQVCKYPSCNKGCEWIPLTKTYPDYAYNTLNKQIATRTEKSHIAYRIIHTKLGVLATFKMGHDSRLFVQSNEENIRKLQRARESKTRRAIGRLGEGIHRPKP